MTADPPDASHATHATHAARIRALPLFAGPVDVRPLAGGLSNANYVADDGRRKLMVRIGGDLPFHHVFRAREAAASRAAHAAGLSPALVHGEEGLAAFDFIEGRSLAAADVVAERVRITALIRRCHLEIAPHLTGPGAIFWVFHVIRDYAATLRQAGAAPDDLDELLAIAGRLEAAQVPLPIVFGHHDLLPANILDDGRRLWLIDWEYGAFGTPLFDLANLAGNAGFGRDDEIALLADYFGAPPDAALLRAFDAMRAASLLREALWSLVSGCFLSAPGADYAAYAASNFALFRSALAPFEDPAS